jgi:hypothetical protein
LRLEELQAQVREDGRFEQLGELVKLDKKVNRHLYAVKYASCTNDCNLKVAELLDERTGMVVHLREKAEIECCNGVVAPGAGQMSQDNVDQAPNRYRTMKRSCASGVDMVLRRRRRSASSGDVIRITLRF